MISSGVIRMRIEGISFDWPNVREVLASPTARLNIARILGQWEGSQQPALLFVLIGEKPFADVYAEEELLSIFPDATIVESDTGGRDIEVPLRVFVADKQGTTVYRIADPRPAERMAL
jgi:hypothetical protein